MSNPLKEYTQSTADWRKNIALNKRRTYFVIGSFILIYLVIGLVIDTYLYSGAYPQASLSAIVVALLTLQLKPFVTLIAVAIAIISLLITFKFHNKLMLLGTDHKEITAENATSIEEKQLYNVVEEMKVAAGLTYMPRVFIINANYMNAFASGYSEKSAMVAITQGLIQKLDRAELQAVMAHELSHIRHMDIKLTLMASVLSNITLIMLDILFYSALFGRRGSDNGRSRNQLFVIIMLLRFLLPLLTILLMLYLSRTREYMADAGAVELCRDNEPLAQALLKINQDHHQNKAQYANDYRTTAHENVRREAYIFDPVQAGIKSTKSFADSFSTHPGLKKRLAALGFREKHD